MNREKFTLETKIEGRWQEIGIYSNNRELLGDIAREQIGQHRIINEAYVEYINVLPKRKLEAVK